MPVQWRRRPACVGHPIPNSVAQASRLRFRGALTEHAPLNIERPYHFFKTQ